MTDVIPLMSSISKGLHLLHEEDVNLHGKINYDAVHRLARPKLDDLLRLNVPGAQ